MGMNVYYWDLHWVTSLRHRHRHGRDGRDGRGAHGAHDDHDHRRDGHGLRASNYSDKRMSKVPT